MKLKFIKKPLLVLFSLCILTCWSFAQESFKKDQLRYSRVREAYADKKEVVFTQLTKLGVGEEKFDLYLRAFKAEEEIEVWVRPQNSSKYQLAKKFQVCESSGDLGPKRAQGDYQVPEGYYHIDRFNPSSSFFLSLGINYPNRSDRVLGNKDSLGGDIFIHGSCVTIGCLPITDDKIKELYVFCVEAKSRGQSSIPVGIFPKRLSDQNYEKLRAESKDNKDAYNLWEDLKKGYDYFELHRKLPTISFLNNGRHRVNGL